MKLLSLISTYSIFFFAEALRISETPSAAQAAHDQAISKTDLQPCKGDTRGNMKCNNDETHRVCA